MKLIKPKVEFFQQSEGLEGVYKQIELAGRTCYRSEDKITEDSAKGFVERMIKSGHTAMLEHGTVYLKCEGEYNSKEPYKIGNPPVISPLRHYKNNPYSKYRVVEDYDSVEECSKFIVYVTTNYRVLVENGWLNDLKYFCEPTEYHKKRYTVKLITDIGITRELNRHRVNSVAEQSTRYCNFSKDKFNNELSICLNKDIKEEEVIKAYTKWYYPEEQGTIDWSSFCCMCNTIGSGHSDHFNIIDTWLFANLACQWSYMRLLKLGWKPQQARRVLPLGLNSEIVHTAFESDWKHFLDLRYHGTTGEPHPDCKELAGKIYELFKKKELI